MFRINHNQVYKQVSCSCNHIRKINTRVSLSENLLFSLLINNSEDLCENYLQLVVRLGLTRLDSGSTTMVRPQGAPQGINCTQTRTNRSTDRLNLTQNNIRKPNLGKVFGIISTTQQYRKKNIFSYLKDLCLSSPEDDRNIEKPSHHINKHLAHRAGSDSAVHGVLKDILYRTQQ